MKGLESGSQRESQMCCQGGGAVPPEIKQKLLQSLDELSPHSCGYLNSLQRVHSFWLPERLS